MMIKKTIGCGLSLFIAAASLSAVSLASANSQTPNVKLDDRDDRLEQNLSKEYPARLRRNGAVLALKPVTGSIKLFKNVDSDSDTFRRYQLKKYFPAIEYALLETAFYEGGTYDLINMRNGQQTNVDGDVVLSPDQQRFAVAHADIEAGYAPNVLSVYFITSNGLIKEFDIRPTEWGAEEIKWDSANSISFTKRYWKKDQIAKSKHTLQFQGSDIKKQGKWISNVKD
jgi:hypothetical protein